MLWKPADSTAAHLQLLVLVSTLVAVKTHDVYLINFLSNSPRLVSWDLGEDQEKESSLPSWPVTLASGNKDQCECYREFSLPNSPGSTGMGGGLGGRGWRVILHGIRSLVVAHFSTSTTEIRLKSKL